MKCHNCDKNAMFTVGDDDTGKFPLCLDCHVRLQASQRQQLAVYERVINYLTSSMELTVGLPGLLPRFPEPAQPQVLNAGNVALNNISVTNSEVGVLNTGTIQDVDATVTVLKESGQERLGSSIADLSEAAIRSSELSDAAKEQLLEFLSAISAEAVAPKDKRRGAVVKALIKQASTVLKDAGALVGAWEKVRGLLEQLPAP